MNRSLHTRLASFGLTIGLIVSMLVHSALAAEMDLLRLVRPEVGLCVSASGWNPGVKQPNAWFQRVKESPLYRGW